jgi:branched-chain amino acid transport system permease protein
VNFRIQSFVVGGMIMGLAGGVFGSWFSAIAPTTFSDLFGTFLVWAMLIVGGSGNNRGAVVGAVVVMLFWFGLPLVQTDLPDFLGTRVFELRQMTIGLLIVLFLIFRPQGLLPERRRVSRFAPRPPGGVSTMTRLRTWMGARQRPPPDPPPAPQERG